MERETAVRIIEAIGTTTLITKNMAKKMLHNVEWVLITDESFYDMFCVHPKHDTAYDSPRRFHFVYKEDAEKFKELIEKSHCAVPNDR